MSIVFGKERAGEREKTSKILKPSIHSCDGGVRSSNEVLLKMNFPANDWGGRESAKSMSGKFTFINYDIRKGLDTLEFLFFSLNIFMHASHLLSGECAHTHTHTKTTTKNRHQRYSKKNSSSFDISFFLFYL